MRVKIETEPLSKSSEFYRQSVFLNGRHAKCTGWFFLYLCRLCSQESLFMRLLTNEAIYQVQGTCRGHLLHKGFRSVWSEKVTRLTGAVFVRIVSQSFTQVRENSEG